MTSISDLPRDLIEEILSRVPITSLRTVGSTCKQWNTLSKHQIFIKKHCGKAAKEYMLNVTYHGKEFPLVRFNLQNTKELTSSIKKIGSMLTLVKIYQVYQCDGLLLLFTLDNFRLVVWNPYLGHTRWIEPKNSFNVSDKYAIGYDNKKNHKVLRKFFNEFKIYEFKSNSWRVLDITSDCFFHSSASLKGNTYFVVHQRWKYFIICFDFTTERFGPFLQLPFDFVGKNVTLSCVREEQLAVFVHGCSLATYKMEIWITTKIEPNAVSWSKFLKVDVQIERNSRFLIEFPVFSFFIDKEKKVAVVCGRHFVDFRLKSIIVGEDRYFKETVLGEVFSYVPSLVQIQ